MIEQNVDVTTLESELVLSVDPEPPSFRLFLLGILFVSFTATYILLTALMGVSSCNLLGLFAGLIVGAGAMQVAERYFKPRWQSDKHLMLQQDSIGLRHKSKHEQLIDPEQHVNVLTWRFEVPRRTRVPKGWYVVALALEQDDVYLPVYTLISPTDFQQIPLTDQFHRLTKKQEDQRNLRLAGQQRRLLRAEQARNFSGYELQQHDFITLIHWLQKHFPNWMIVG